MNDRSYRIREYNHLRGLKGLSDAQLEQHVKLYEGYVKNTNLLQEQLQDMLMKGMQHSPIFAEIARRLSFEKNGMVLHEFYFENLCRGGKEMGQGLRMAISDNFGTVDAYLKELDGLSKMRGVGWVTTLMDPATRRLYNQWVTLHQDGNIAGHKVILAIDVWEHAWTMDYRPTERAKYLTALFDNIDWSVFETRLGR
jgi:Fe-Mn family superoxide dismutase